LGPLLNEVQWLVVIVTLLAPTQARAGRSALDEAAPVLATLLLVLDLSRDW